MSSLYFCIFPTQHNHQKHLFSFFQICFNFLFIVPFISYFFFPKSGFEPHVKANGDYSSKINVVIFFFIFLFQLCFNSLFIFAFISFIFSQVRVWGSRARATKWWFPQILYFQQPGGDKPLNNLFIHVHRKLPVLLLIYRLCVKAICWDFVLRHILVYFGILRYTSVYFGILWYTSFMSIAKGRRRAFKRLEKEKLWSYQRQ